MSQSCMKPRRELPLSSNSRLEVLPGKGVGASPSLPLASIMTTLSRVGLNTVRRIDPVLSRHSSAPGGLRADGACKTQVENVTTDPARDHKSGRVVDRNDRPYVVADAGVDPAPSCQSRPALRLKSTWRGSHR